MTGLLGRAFGTTPKKREEGESCPWHQYKQAFICLSIWARKMARQIAGENFPKIEDQWLHRILQEASFCRPFAASAGSNATPGSSWPRGVDGDQDQVHVRLPLPAGPTIRKVIVTATARDQGWCSDPSQGAWTWGELAWRSLEDVREGPGDEPRFRAYTNAVNVHDWQEHSVSFEGERLQQLLAARPAPLLPGGQSELLFVIRSRFPGWRQWVSSATVTVEWEWDMGPAEIAGEEVHLSTMACGQVGDRAGGGALDGAALV
eukprot:jgi/Ulvmu1/12681/UM094_0038.1